MNPTVSVVMPAKDAGEWIGDAIESILAQTLGSLELIVVNDGSGDDTRDIAAGYANTDDRVRLVDTGRSSGVSGHQTVDTNAGYLARNVGLRHVSADWVTFQDADDFSVLNRLEVQLALLARFDARHLTTSCFWLEPEWRNVVLDMAAFESDFPLAEPTVAAAATKQLASESLGTLSKSLPDWLFGAIPFEMKRRRPLRPLFFANELPFPGAANSTMFHRSFLERAQFRPLSQRRWPSLKGRGADRDFSFELAYRYGRSVHANVPVYAWRTPRRFEVEWDLGRYLRPLT